jgi:hypothetical protein
MGVVFQDGVCNQSAADAIVPTARLGVRVAHHGGDCDRPPGLLQSSDAVWRDTDGSVWIPVDAAGLQLCICDVGHFGVAGHRATETTLAAVKERFV